MDNKNTDDVSKRLRLFRKKLKLTQRKMADAVLIRQASYSDLENGKTSVISKQTLKLFELILGMNVHWLFTGEGEMLVHENIGNLLSEKTEAYAKNHVSIDKSDFEKMIELTSSLQKLIDNYSKK